MSKRDPNASDPNASDPNASDPNASDPNASDPNAPPTAGTAFLHAFPTLETVA